MKITKIDIMQVHTKRPRWRPVVCRIYTDEGIYGDGDTALTFGVGAFAAVGMLRDLAKLLIGCDPLDTEVLWNKCYRDTFWGQNAGPIQFAAMSCLDIALWDIKGKFFNVPIYKLLGGKRRNSLRTYACQLQYGWYQEGIKIAGTTQEYVNAALSAQNEGYDAVKFDFFTYDVDKRNFTTNERVGLLKPYYVELIEERVAGVRDAVGKEVDIIVENHAYTDVNSAIQIGKRLEKYNILYYEEPTTPDPRLTKLVHNEVNIPLASGERIYSRWQYAPYFENGSLNIIQPDIGNCGGITEAKKICDMANVYDVGVQAHVCSSPLATAAALHLECVIPNFVIHEHHVFNLYDFNKELCIYDYQPVNGQYFIPDLPGLGNELSEYALTHCEKFTVE